MKTRRRTTRTGLSMRLQHFGTLAPDLGRAVNPCKITLVFRINLIKQVRIPTESGIHPNPAKWYARSVDERLKHVPSEFRFGLHADVRDAPFVPALLMRSI